MERMNEIMKHERRTDRFIRKGVIGGHKDDMPPQFIKKFDKWISDSVELNPGFPVENNNWKH